MVLNSYRLGLPWVYPVTGKGIFNKLFGNEKLAGITLTSASNTSLPFQKMERSSFFILQLEKVLINHSQFQLNR